MICVACELYLSEAAILKLFFNKINLKNVHAHKNLIMTYFFQESNYLPNGRKFLETILEGMERKGLILLLLLKVLERRGADM